jgi:hypothetical protein
MQHGAKYHNQNVQIARGAQPASYSVGTAVSLSVFNAADA